MSEREYATDEASRFGAERAKTFVDAVVAIAMTLLILPLMESVNDAASQGDDAWVWVEGHVGQLFAFVLSFAIIAMFWINHHRLFARVEQVTTMLLWITMAWLLSIVWLPVVTAMVGLMPSHDRVLLAMYIGSMLLTAALSFGTRLYLRAHPTIHVMDPGRLMDDIAADLATLVLFAASLLLAVLLPVVTYYALLLMFLTRPVQRGFARMLGARRAAS
jgi:uncharacterized membrane protein